MHMGVLRKELATGAAHKMLRVLLDERLNEAEAIYAIMIASTLRLAIDCEAIEDLQLKIDKAGKLFSQLLPQNIKAFEAALEAAKQARS